MLQYYLLMRGTRRLALEYKALIDEKAALLVLNVKPAQPSPSGGATKRKASGLGSQATPAGNAPETNAASLDAGDYAQQAVHTVGVDDLLMHRFAEELSEGAKVRGYLATSIHDDYDYRVGS
ncbi:hypothetical protein FRC10_006700 [Ceratobasidium sp. 414]|nr:hypothetical protein FRC10_006700 [Ceratobasidium sp. 414]